MFTWLKRHVTGPAQPVRKSVAKPVRTTAKAVPTRADASRHAPRFVDTAPLPEVVAEGNTQADWSVWEDSVMALDSQMQDMVPSNRVYVRDTGHSQLDPVDAFASVRGKRDV
ncbi:hypothetical protein GCM10028796_30640 [Ramlibacter monticola]|uniref:Uncharacterized protein n=1 Tax=Ramlibacter monticola TaxID=1926872 RepID=A0A936Z6J5_9BURK|nr:hypothetical protein [Ramlibacter monticola]MBL0394716.1 hypothetical protein [Ramlibacter monticola]